MTNQFGLPDVVVKAVVNQQAKYSKGEADFSMTELLNPPYMYKILEDHAGDVTEDVADALYAMVGSLGHEIFELAAEGDVALHEERFFATIEGAVVSGQADLVEDREINDFKFTSVEKYLYGDKMDWERQLNGYRVLAGMNGYTINKLTIVAIFRNWVKRMKTDPGYPAYPVVMIDIPVWSKLEAWEFMKERVRLHKMRRTHQLEDIEPCSQEERWIRESYWIAIKPGNKRATKRFTSEEEANEWLDDSSVRPSKDRRKIYEIQEKVGVPVRCASWCAASKWCPSYKEWKTQNTDNQTWDITK